MGIVARVLILPAVAAAVAAAVPITAAVARPAAQSQATSGDPGIYYHT
jgi:hypothetical protein